MTSLRSTAGCYMCKSKHKKCDETKPHCLRCQKSRIQCPGYVYIRGPNRSDGKPRTLPGPRSVGQSRATMLQAHSLASAGESSLQPPPDNGPAAYHPPHGTRGASVRGKVADDVHMSNRLAPSSSINGSIPHLTSDSHASYGPGVNTLDSGRFQPSPNTSIAKPMTSGQASLLAALFSLSQPPTQPGANPNERSVSTLAPEYRKEHVNGFEVATNIHPQLVLDKTAESNALPFVLQGYTALISRMAFEPLKLMSSARDLVFRHFEGGEESRWIVSLLANIGSRITTMGAEAQGNTGPLISALNSTVRRWLASVKSHPNSTRPEQAKALGSALEVLAIHVYTSSVEAITLSQTVAPLFRQFSSESPGAPINLISLLQHPVGCIRQYAATSVICSVITDLPMLLPYDVPLPGSQPSNPLASSPTIREDSVIQWVYGVPNQVVLLFATMKTMHQGGFVPNAEMTVLLEQDIHNIPLFSGSSSDRFLTIMRSVVQECWRQAAFVYLYMALCGDSSDTPRVVEAFERFMRLLNRTRPGRFPDEFLTSPLIIVSPAAQKIHDREIIKRRAMRLQQRGQPFPTNGIALRVIEGFWARADAEGRPIVWSDLAVSRRRLLGV